MRLLTADEVAAMLAVPTSWVYGAARSGTLPSVRAGRYVRFATEDVEAWINAQRTNGTNGGARDR